MDGIVHLHGKWRKVGCAHSSRHHSTDIPYNVYHVYQDLKKVSYIGFQCQNIYQGTQNIFTTSSTCYDYSHIIGSKKVIFGHDNKKCCHTFNFAQNNSKFGV